MVSGNELTTGERKPPTVLGNRILDADSDADGRGRGPSWSSSSRQVERSCSYRMTRQPLRSRFIILPRRFMLILYEHRA